MRDATFVLPGELVGFYGCESASAIQHPNDFGTNRRPNPLDADGSRLENENGRRRGYGLWYECIHLVQFPW
jgi:hypothetical protein